MRFLLTYIMAIGLILSGSSAMAVGRLQNEDFKSLAELKSIITITGSVSSGSACITSPSSLVGITAGLFVYDSTTSANINSGVTVVGIPGTCSAGQIQLSSNSAGTGVADTITFGGQKSQLLNDTKIYVSTNSINDTLSNAIATGKIGGGAYVITAVQSVSAAGNISVSLTDPRQLRHIQGNAASVTTATTPFGSSAPQDGAEITLIGNDDTNSVIIPFNDAAKGCVGNFSSIEVTKYKIVSFIYSASLDRYILVQGGM